MDSISDKTSVFKDSPLIAALISSSKSLDVNAAGDPGGVRGGEQLMGSGELENKGFLKGSDSTEIGCIFILSMSTGLAETVDRISASLSIRACYFFS